MDKSPLNSTNPPLRAKSISILNLILSAAGPVIIGIILLFLEYRSGYFQASGNSAGVSLRSYYYYSVYLSVALLMMGAFLIKAVEIWAIPRSYIREHLSLMEFIIFILSTIILISSVVLGVTPWSAINNIISTLIIKGDLNITTFRFIDLGFELLCYIFVLQFLVKYHQAWHGRISEEQYKHEQSGDKINFILEGFSEFIRVIRRTPPLKTYNVIDSKQFVSQLEPVIDDLDWNQRAKELIKLSSTSYTFDDERGWHDIEKCWVGYNLNTGELVFIYPVQDGSEIDKISSFISYANRVSEKRKKKIGELIIAVKTGELILPPDIQTNSIRLENEYSLLNKLIDFRNYFNEIKRRAQSVRLSDSDYTLKDVYVPSTVSIDDTQVCDIEEYLNKWLSENNQRQLALLGEYGQGKSTATLMWAYHIINTLDISRDRIPLLIELRGTSPRNLTPLQLLGAWAAKYSINPLALLRLHIAGRIILIFEGFDEMALVGDSEMRLKHFRTLWQFAYPNAKIIVTGRPNFFFDEEELKAALGIGKPMSGKPHCEAIRLNPFTINQIVRAVRPYDEITKKGITDLAKSNTRFLEIISRPSLLHIVATLWDREKLFEKTDKLTSAFIMELFIRHSFRRQGLKEYDSKGFMALNSSEREYFMRGIATFMAAHDLPNQISSSQLDNIIDGLIDSIPDAVSLETPLILGETRIPLKKRLLDSEYGIDHVKTHIKTDVRACGLLVDDPAAPGTFRFGHKSFMEYLFAAVVAEFILDTNSVRARAIMKETGAYISHILRLPTSTEFFSELMVSSITSRPEFKLAGPKLEVSISKSILSALFSHKSLVLLQFKAAVFFELFLRRLSQVVIPFNINNRTKRFILISIGVPCIMLSVFILRRMLPFKGIDRSIYLVLFPALVLFSLLTLPSMILIAPVSRSRIRLWCQICAKIDVKPKSLHKIFGTNLIPGIDVDHFDLFDFFDHFPR
jgi:hypothetical protein